MLFAGMMALAGAAVVDHARSARRPVRGGGGGARGHGVGLFAFGGLLRGGIKAEGVCQLVLPGVRKCAPFEEGIPPLVGGWVGGWVAHPLGWG